MDSHRNYPPDEHDGRWSPGERGFPDPEWDPRGGDPRYQPGPGEASYDDSSYGPPQGQPAGYGDPAYGDAPAYPPPPGYKGEPAAYPGGDPGYGARRTGDGPGYGGYQPEGYDSGAQATGLLGTVGPRSGEALPPVSGTSGAAGVGPAAPPLPPLGGLPGMPDQAPHGHPRGGSADGGPESQTVRHSTEPLDRSALRRPAGGPGPLGDGVYKSRRPGTAVALVAITVVMELVALRLLVFALFTRTTVGGALASSFVVLGLPMLALGLYGLLGGNAAAPGAGARVWLRTPLVYLPVALTLFLAAGLAAAG